LHTKKFVQLILVVQLSFIALAAVTSLPAASQPLSNPTPSALIRINEILLHPTGKAHQWVELENKASISLNLGGFGLTDEDGLWYYLPNALPPVPPGAFVLIQFDGQGSQTNDYDFTDSVAVLHTPAGIVDIFDPDTDQCALYRLSRYIYLPLLLKKGSGTGTATPSPFAGGPTAPVIDFVAWGNDPGSDARNAVLAEVWLDSFALSLYRGAGINSPELALQPGESLGRLPHQPDGPDSWTLYQAFEVTPGATNALPAVSWTTPASGSTLLNSTFYVGWNTIPGAAYRFQLDTDADFNPPLTETLQTTPTWHFPEAPEGTFYWRVKTLYPQGESAWSAKSVIHSLALPITNTPGLYATTAYTIHVLGVRWQMQHKDTNMLCLSGDEESGAEAWDRPHAAIFAHEEMYCVRASISMLASYYGGRLSQDRISYQIFQGKRGGPGTDLGHNIGVDLPPDPNTPLALAWALGTPVSNRSGCPTFEDIKSWIDTERPFMAATIGHMQVIDGYAEVIVGPLHYRFVHWLDPYTEAFWESYEDLEQYNSISDYWVCPPGVHGAPNVRSDEDENENAVPDTMEDSDGDGLVDFDERYRFLTDPNDIDTDDDEVPDKLEIHEYVYDPFEQSGTYTFRYGHADFDEDGKRKEKDPDNDNPWDLTAWDGAEDTNHNGMFEPEMNETSNFNPVDDRLPKIEITAPPFGYHSDYRCEVDISGFIAGEGPLTSPQITVSVPEESATYQLFPAPVGNNYYFQSTVRLFHGANLITVSAVNPFGTGRNYTIVYALCE